MGAVYRRNLWAGLAHVALIFTAGRVFRWGSGLSLDISPSFLVAYPPPGCLPARRAGPQQPWTTVPIWCQERLPVLPLIPQQPSAESCRRWPG